MENYILALIFSRAQLGIEAPVVSVEIHIAGGLPRFTIVGLPETAVRESKDRVRFALLNSQYRFPMGRITVNLAPASLPKEGGRFDLPIAIGILAATRQIDTSAIAKHEFVRELGLMGNVRGGHGVLPADIEAHKAARSLIVAASDAAEAKLIRQAHILETNHLLEVCSHLCSAKPLQETQYAPPMHEPSLPDLVDVKGKHQTRRALEVAAGGHHILLIGPPRAGKTLLATRLPSILPALLESEAIESAVVRSVSSVSLYFSQWTQRPFRAPHHSASAASLVGGGRRPKPGEISLAHNGVLFLDELPEYERRVLEGLREPMESGFVTISRAATQVQFPARFQLIAAMNPCPCGWLGDPSGKCTCTHDQVRRYQARLSGPLLDRIDLQIDVLPLDPTYLYGNPVMAVE